MELFDSIIKKHSNGTTINLFVTADSKKCVFPAGFNKWRRRIDIKVSAKAKDNQANIEVVKIIAEFFNKPVKNVYIISGKKAKEKTVLIKDVSTNTATKKLKESLNGLYKIN
jgi:uncharacterized protein (TIGR00251 family)